MAMKLLDNTAYGPKVTTYMAYGLTLVNVYRDEGLRP